MKAWLAFFYFATTHYLTIFLGKWPLRKLSIAALPGALS